MVIEHKACSPAVSVAVKVTMCVPASPVVGVHEKTLLTGRAVVGSAGDIDAPDGRPTALSVIVWPKSASEACTVKLNGSPASTVSVPPHVGVGGLSNTGGTPACATSWMRKSTAT